VTRAEEEVELILTNHDVRYNRAKEFLMEEREVRGIRKDSGGGYGGSVTTITLFAHNNLLLLLLLL